MNVRLMLFLAVSAALAVVAVSALVAPVPDDGREEPSPTAGREEAATPGPEQTELRPAAGRPFVLSAEKTGQVVSLPPETEARVEVHSDRPVSIQLGDDGPIEFAEPGTPAVFPVYGDPGAEGPIRRLDEPERDIGRVELAR